MTIADLLVDAFGRVHDAVHEVLDDLTEEELSFRVDSGANSIAWLVWHLSRVQDDHVAGVARIDQVWKSSGWAERFKLPLEDADTGYGHGSDQVAAVKADAEALCGYHDSVYEMTLGFASGLAEADLDRVVDKGWDPPVTLGVRLVSVVSDCLQHTGQAAYVRGILERR
jgi:uncharacterized damage-inducible protein DinB